VKSPQAAAGESETLYPKSADGEYRVDAGRADVSGVWQFDVQPLEGDPERRLAAVNVVPGEGDLHLVSQFHLARRLPGLDYQYSLASQMSRTGDNLAGFLLSDTLLYLLAAALLVEQWLAYRASYHSRPETSR
jgi:hypothetical protein